MTITLQPRKVSFGMTGTQKYRAKPTVVDGIRFASKKEAKRWPALLLLQANGEVRNIKRQVRYTIAIGGVHVCHYQADFVYEELRGVTWSEVVEDVKGYLTPMYRLKKRLMKACHGIEIRET